MNNPRETRVAFPEMSFSSYRSAHTQLRHFFELMSDGTVTKLPTFNTRVRNLLLNARKKSLEDNKPFTLQDLISIRGLGDIGINSVLQVVTKEPEVALNVIKYITYYRVQFTGANGLSASSTVKKPPNVLSLDFGLSESAYCLLEDKVDSYAVRKWAEVDISIPKPYNPQLCYMKIQEGVVSLPKAGIYILEKQSHRNVAGGFLAVSLGLRIIEAMTYGVLGNRCTRVCSVEPQRVSNYFLIGKNSGRTKNKKTNATNLALQMLLEGQTSPFGNTVFTSKQLLDRFYSLDKKDDLSDSLLQAVAFLDWSQMSSQL